MLVFASGRAGALQRFLAEDGAGGDPCSRRLAQALSALYPPGTEEKSGVDGVLGRTKSWDSQQTCLPVSRRGVG
jgi:hypothetical protein